MGTLHLSVLLFIQDIKFSDETRDFPFMQQKVCDLHQKTERRWQKMSRASAAAQNEGRALELQIQVRQWSRQLRRNSWSYCYSCFLTWLEGKQHVMLRWSHCILLCEVSVFKGRGHMRTQFPHSARQRPQVSCLQRSRESHHSSCCQTSITAPVRIWDNKWSWIKSTMKKMLWILSNSQRTMSDLSGSFEIMAGDESVELLRNVSLSNFMSAHVRCSYLWLRLRHQGKLLHDCNSSPTWVKSMFSVLIRISPWWLLGIDQQVYSQHMQILPQTSVRSAGLLHLSSCWRACMCVQNSAAWFGSVSNSFHQVVSETQLMLCSWLVSIHTFSVEVS